MRGKQFLCLLFGLVFSLAGIQPAPVFALSTIPESLAFEYDLVYSGAPPAGFTPWLTATFDANITSSGDPDGSVRLTMAAPNLNLDDGEFVTNWYFNLDPELNKALESSLLEAAPVGTPAAGWSFSTKTMDMDKDFKAGPDGFYDIRFMFDPSNGANGDRFTAGEILRFDLSIPSIKLVPDDFNFFSDPGDKLGDQGPFLSAVHVQGGIEDSGWIAPNPNPNRNPNPVPEPATMLLVGMGLVGLAGVGRRRFRK